VDRVAKTLVVAPVWNEAARIGAVVDDVRRATPHDILVVDDGSTDATPEIARQHGAQVISHPRNQGVGAAIRTGIRHAIEHQYEILVVTNGAGKTPAEGIPRLVAPIAEAGCDFVQGSRYLPGSELANLPFHRSIGTRFYSALFSLFTGRRITDGTSGFRAIRVAILEDPRFRLDEPWLNRYELEPYLYYKTLQFGFKVKEVGVKVAYPATGRYTRMRVLTDWWKIIRPLFYLRLGIRK
jgi:dolichol-phosphate mannosyltransferase